MVGLLQRKETRQVSQVTLSDKVPEMSGREWVEFVARESSGKLIKTIFLRHIKGGEGFISRSAGN